MRGLLSALLLSLYLFGCEPEQVPATQTVVRIDATPSVRAAMQKLRVRTSALQGSLWEKRNDKVFTLEELPWPVDIVVTPRAESQADKQFELIADALDASNASLVQRRVLTGFVRRQQRILTVTLDTCGNMPFGSLCEPDLDCLGPSCLTCVDGNCVATPLSSPEVLTPLVPPDEGEGGIPVSVPPDIDGSIVDPMDAGLPADGGVEGGVDTGVPNDTGPGQTGCDPGSERNTLGVCSDIDECARMLDDCDHEPGACVNGMGGFSCACPTGYRGMGRGANGCVDIDECTEQTDTCDALAACVNTAGGYSCGNCPSGYSPGAGGACVDINECTTANGGCDTSPMAICNNRAGMANTCSCPSGYTGNGVGASGCADPCASNPCGGGLVCSRSALGTATCSAACAATGAGGCQPGDTCVTDADCRLAGDTAATCDATSKVCVTVCATISITSQANLDAARYCREITGDLLVNPNFATIPATAMPYLTRVRGNVSGGSASGNTVFQAITLNTLQTVDGNVEFIFVQNLARATFPRLTSIGGVLTFGVMPSFQQLSLPLLTTVTRNVSLTNLPMTQLDIGRLQTIGGTLNLSSLCQLPWSQVSRISALVASPTVSNIGCCAGTTVSQACSGSCTCN
jgi:hypothetical protein